MSQSGTFIIRGKFARISRDREMDISEFRGNFAVNFQIFAAHFRLFAEHFLHIAVKSSRHYFAAHFCAAGSWPSDRKLSQRKLGHFKSNINLIKVKNIEVFIILKLNKNVRFPLADRSHVGTS